MVFRAVEFALHRIDEFGAGAHDVVELQADLVPGLQGPGPDRGTEAAQHGRIERIVLGKPPVGARELAHPQRLDDAHADRLVHGGGGERALVPGGGLADEVRDAGDARGRLDQRGDALGIVAEAVDLALEIGDEFGFGDVDAEVDEGRWFR